MARSCYPAAVVLASLVAFAGSAVATEESSDGCVNCHSDPGFFVRDKKLHDYYQGWLQSPHAAAGKGCHDLSGGRPSKLAISSSRLS